MRLEQIRNRVHAMGDHLGGMAAQIREDLLAELDRAIEDDAAKEAERALPVTREWLDETLESTWFEDEWTTKATATQMAVQVSLDKFSLKIVHGGAFVKRLDADIPRGQLLDLLSGLGVTK